MTAVSFSIFWEFWYRAPTCSDGLKNGDETGIDCGGSCSLVCSMQAQAPILRSDPRVFKVMDNIYSVLSFVENHNVNFKAPYVPYKFKVYDEKNVLLYEREGATVLPQNKTVAIFEGNMLIVGGIPKRAEIELSPKISWIRSAVDEPEIDIQSSSLLREGSYPRIAASVYNKSIQDLKNIELIAVIFDSRDNAVAASRTFINRLLKNEKADVFFTWPKPFDLGIKACSQPSDVILAIDRSGSMASISKNPPEPLSSVKAAAGNFVRGLKEGDRAGLVSFATVADSLTATPITKDFNSLELAIEAIAINKDGTQYTNIADAINKSFNALLLSSLERSQKIIVLLTDGIATRPENPKGSKTEAEAVSYAEKAALEAANLAKQNGTIIYTIGLGKDIHQEFLRKIATSPSNYLEAPATNTLRDVYSKISTSICKELPARIEITYKILEVTRPPEGQGN